MKGLIEKWIINAAIGFVIRQVAKFEKQTDWAKVKADLIPRVEALVPGKWFDAEAIQLVHDLLDACERAFENTKSLEIVLQLLADEKYTEASEKLRSYLLKSWKPETAVANRAKSYIESYQFV